MQSPRQPSSRRRRIAVALSALAAAGVVALSGPSAEVPEAPGGGEAAGVRPPTVTVHAAAYGRYWS